MIKVLFVTHQLSFNKYGGAETQILKTLEKINKLENNSFKVKLYDMWTDSIEDYDIVHIFKPTAFPIESYSIAKYAKDNGVKVVVSPIYYFHNISKNMSEMIINSLKERIILCRKYTSKTSPLTYLDPYRHSENLFMISDAILPNTYEELKLLKKVFDIPNEKCHIIPNGVDLEFKYGNSSYFNKNYGLDNFILFIGRIEQRKNVLKLIQAFVKSNIDTSLVIIGKVIDTEYYEECRRSSNKKVIFLSPIPHDSELLKSAYKAAKVVALPSECETPGLVALEGGLAGASIVITEIGGTKEYFGKYSRYVNPSNEEDIKKALIEAYKSPKSNYLSTQIEKNFTWEKVAEMTTNVYKNII